MSTSATYTAAQVFLDEINAKALLMFEERLKDKPSSHLPVNDSSAAQSADVFLQEVINKVVINFSNKLSSFVSFDHELSDTCKNKGQHSVELMGNTGNFDSHNKAVACVDVFISSGWSLDVTEKPKDGLKTETALDSEKCSEPGEMEESSLYVDSDKYIKSGEMEESSIQGNTTGSLVTNSCESKTALCVDSEKCIKSGEMEESSIQGNTTGSLVTKSCESKTALCVDSEKCSKPGEMEESSLQGNTAGSLVANRYDDWKVENTRAKLEAAIQHEVDKQNDRSLVLSLSENSEPHGTSDSTTVIFKPARELFHDNSQENLGCANIMPSSQYMSCLEPSLVEIKSETFPDDSRISSSPELNTVTESHYNDVETHKDCDGGSKVEIRPETKESGLNNVEDLINSEKEDQEVPGAEEVIPNQEMNVSLYDLNVLSDETDPVSCVEPTNDVSEIRLVPLSYQWFSTPSDDNNEVKPLSAESLTRVHPIPSCNRRRRVGLSRNQRVRPLHFKRLKMAEE